MRLLPIAATVCLCLGACTRSTPSATTAPPSTPAATTAPATAPPSTAPTATLAPTPAAFGHGTGAEGEPRFSTTKGVCDPYPPPSLDGIYQVSAPRGGYGADGRTITHPYVSPGEVVQLGLRDKNGYADGPKQPTYAKARVIAPDGTSTTTEGSLAADQWLYVHYPSDFAGATKVYPAGVYTVIWTQSLNGGFLACDGFWAG